MVWGRRRKVEATPSTPPPASSPPKVASSSNVDDDDDEDPSTMDEEKKRFLLALACEHDRVDILQRILAVPEEVKENGEDEAGGGRNVKMQKMQSFDLSLLNNPPEEHDGETDAQHANDENNNNETNAEHENEHEHEHEHEHEEEEEGEYDEEEYDEEADSDYEEGEYSDEEYSDEESYASEDNENNNTSDSKPLYFIPPLHIAVSSGSVNATTALLRMGANPSVIPTNTDQIPLSGPMAKFRRAELSHFGAYQMLLHPDTLLPTWTHKSDIVDRLRHAFAAEALRAIGSDEPQRLKELLDGGMPSDVEVGGNTLYQWTKELQAWECRKLICPEDAALQQQEQEEQNKETHAEQNGTFTEQTVPDENLVTPVKQQQQQPNHDSTPPPPPSPPDDAPFHTPSPTPGRRLVPTSTMDSLRTALEEQKNLATSLSTCLDSLVEEGSLYEAILYGEEHRHRGGQRKTSLSSSSSSKEDHHHSAFVPAPSPTTTASKKANLVKKVRSLKAEKAQQVTELAYYRELWGEAEEELEHLKMANAWIAPRRLDEVRRAEEGETTDKVEEEEEEGEGSAEREEGEREGEKEKEEREEVELKQLLSASQAKVCKLRASIADMAEENARNCSEVERLGLGGAVQLARNLREALREVEYAVQEAKEGEASCREEIEYWLDVQQKAEAEKAKEEKLLGKGDEKGVEKDAAAVWGEAAQGGGDVVEGGEEDEDAAAAWGRAAAVTSSNGGKEREMTNGTLNGDGSGQQAGEGEEEEENKQAHEEEYEDEGSYDDEEEEYDDDEEGSYEDDEEEYDDEEEEEEEELRQSPSAAISSGNSRAIVLRSSKHRYMPIDLFSIFWRMMGLGHETNDADIVRAHGKSHSMNGGGRTRESQVMIV